MRKSFILTPLRKSISKGLNQIFTPEKYVKDHQPNVAFTLIFVELRYQGATSGAQGSGSKSANDSK